MRLNGKVIAIEGTDGSGKQTQSELLIERLKCEGYNVYSTSFPNYSSASSAPVKMYLNGEIGASPSDVDAKVASMFFAIDRYITYKKEFEKLYEQKENVFIFDRYTASNIIHQGSKLMTDDCADENKLREFVLWLNDLEHETLKIPKADITIYLNVPLDFTRKLRENRANKIDNGNKQDIHESNENYLNTCAFTGLTAAKLLGWKVVECVKDGAMRDKESIAEEVWKIILKNI